VPLPNNPQPAPLPKKTPKFAFVHHDKPRSLKLFALAAITRRRGGRGRGEHSSELLLRIQFSPKDKVISLLCPWEDKWELYELGARMRPGSNIQIHAKNERHIRNIHYWLNWNWAHSMYVACAGRKRQLACTHPDQQRVQTLEHAVNAADSPVYVYSVVAV
jgi:hypothetical protein